MQELREANPNHTPDLSDFVAAMGAYASHPVDAVKGLFQPDAPIFAARAPGRLDVMGGIADYSGATVLQWPLQQATLAAVQPAREASALHIVSRNGEGTVRTACVPLEQLQPDGEPLPLEAARRIFAGPRASRWAAYVVGPLLAWMHYRKCPLPHGLNVFVDSTIPEAAGVSSSAALEIATLKAFSGTLETPLTGAEIARLGQQGENAVAGAPCGIMDQIAVTFGEADRLLVLRCQPAKLEGALELPRGLKLWGIDSGERHAISGADYTAVRVGAFMGYRILTELSELPWVPGNGPGHVRIDDVRWKGYLANVSPLTYESEFPKSLPEILSGEAFLDRYRGIIDSVTRVDTDQFYAVRAATEHPIYENARVKRFRSTLNSCQTVEDYIRLGDIMYASHESYRRCELDSEGTNRLVALVRDAGPQADLYGAKITGGGSGGTVAVLGADTPKAEAAIGHIAATYEAETGHRPCLFSGSSPGAERSGTIRINPA